MGLFRRLFFDREYIQSCIVLSTRLTIKMGGKVGREDNAAVFLLHQGAGNSFSTIGELNVYTKNRNK
ncbi:hypothetical protein GCM10022218_33110 [Sphingobacterium ginsenosidimutans]|uniref:Cyclic nucleotide-binding domain-containing protein n=1 Tax=Sphingobacterium ginsenosidimutans TaxID=687845 RepID=A0ABP8A8R9_9SPHI